MHPYQVKTVSEFHNLLGLANPEHPFVSVVNLNVIQPFTSVINNRFSFDFYIIHLRKIYNPGNNSTTSIMD